MAAPVAIPTASAPVAVAPDAPAAASKATAPPSNLTSSVTGIKEVKKIDDYTVAITTKQVASYFPYMAVYLLFTSPASFEKAGKAGSLLAADRTSTIRLGTAIAIAFARTPMLLATIGRDLQDVSSGRVTLGLGTQIRPHIERRYSMPWSRA